MLSISGFRHLISQTQALPQELNRQLGYKMFLLVQESPKPNLWQHLQLPKILEMFRSWRQSLLSTVPSHLLVTSSSPAAAVVDFVRRHRQHAH